MKRAFTLLEILIVMTIIGLLIAIGTGGLIRFRENTEAEQATNELLALLKETQTKAKNNNIPFDHNTDTALFQASKNRNYAFIVSAIRVPDINNIANNRLTLQRRLCWKDPSDTWNSVTLTDLSDCTAPEDLIPTRFLNIEIKDDGNYGTPINNTCDLALAGHAIVFENLTGRIYDKADAVSVTPPNSLNCRFALYIRSQNVNYSYIDFEENNFYRAYQNN